MFETGIEEKILPPFVVTSLAIHVISIYLKNWLEGYYGDVSVTQFGPWFLCNIGCLQCTDSRPHVDCFWMDDWANTGYDIFGIIQYLEYWCLGGLILALIPSLVLCTGSACKSKHCGVDIRRPLLLLLFVSALLSTVSVSLFGTKISQSTDAISNFKDLTIHYGSSFFIRILGTISIWFCCFVAIVQECRVRNRVNSELDSYMIVTQSRTIEEVLEDENEEDGEML